jgi:hypothetical protein
MSAKSSQRRKHPKRSLGRRIMVSSPYRTCVKAIRYLLDRREHQFEEKQAIDLNPKLVSLLCSFKEDVVNCKRKITTTFTRKPITESVR